VLLIAGSVSAIAPKVKNSERNCASVFSRQASGRSTNKDVPLIVTRDYSTRLLTAVLKEKACIRDVHIHYRILCNIWLSLTVGFSKHK